MEINKKITCGIKSFLRKEKLAQCLAALVNHDFLAVIVADDGPISEEKRAVYRHYQSLLPLQLIELPVDTGIAAGRNAIIDACQTEFLLILDDDQIIPPNIADLLHILQSDPEIGGISGIWDEYGHYRCGACDLFLERGFVFQDIRAKKVPRLKGNLRYYIYHFIPNSTLFRMGCLQTARWDPFYKIGSEHLDFYLTHQKLARWKFAITPDVVITHDPRETGTEYRDKYRKNDERLNVSLSYLKQKWNIQGIHEISRHIPLRNVSVARRRLIYRLMKLYLPYPLAQHIASRVPAPFLSR